MRKGGLVDEHGDSQIERYEGVRGSRRVDAIAAAIEASGGRVMRASSPTVAPFEFHVRMQDGKELHLICYAFTAKKYKQTAAQKRPMDEHRLQVKYLSDFDRLHEIYIPKSGNRVTLFFGVHEQYDVFVAVDPAMHNPTWFSRSIEFKEHHIKQALERGWIGWERDRVAKGRRHALPQESLLSEALLAFTPRYFLTYALFERVATGMETGERLLLTQNIGDDLRSGGSARALVAVREEIIEVSADARARKLYGLTVDELLEVIVAQTRLHTAVRGGVAELHLQRALEKTSGVSAVEKFHHDGPPDFGLTFGGRQLRVECKNVSPDLNKGLPFVDFQKTRAAKGDPTGCTRYYSASQFEVLAACLYPLSGVWEYRFSLTENLPEHRKCPKKLSDRVSVENHWPATLPGLFDS